MSFFNSTFLFSFFNFEDLGDLNDFDLKTLIECSLIISK